MLIRSRVPLRVSFAGGGTDVPPYTDTHGGVVLVSTIDKYAYASLGPRPAGGIQVRSLDYDILAKYETSDDLRYDGELDLVKAVLRHYAPDTNAELMLHTDAPPGTGLGSSSAMVVALIGVMRHWLHLPLTFYDVADMAVQIERHELGIKGGLQDQYAAAFGGFNLIEFSNGSVIVNPLRVDRWAVNELEYRLLLCYTGRTRLSSNILARQIARYERSEDDVLAALHQLKQITLQMKNALLQGRLDEFGELMGVTWQNKKRLDGAISSPEIDELYDAARKAGAIGGKILGAGGGGYLLVYCEYDKRHAVAERLEQLGGQVVEFRFEFKGLQTWHL